MEIKILEESKNRMVFELIGEDHTLCNALKKQLWSDGKVKAASYAVKHPSIGIPHIVIETTGKTPRDALVDAAEALKKQTAVFKKLAEKEFK